jgi:phosphoribosyl 1,2-cyclic phosphodiesterase
LITINPLASSSKGNTYWVTDSQTPLLLECGIPFKEIQKGIGFRTLEIEGCLISHCHRDHCKSVKDVLKGGLDVYMSEATKQALTESGDISGGLHRVNVVEPKKQFVLGSWTVLPFELQHDVENFGYLLQNRVGERLVYITDSYYCRYKFSGLTHLMLECNHSRDILNANVASGAVPAAMKKRLIQSHMSLETAKEFLKINDLSKVQEIVLIHLSDGNSDEARFKREIQELTGKLVRVAQA